MNEIKNEQTDQTTKRKGLIGRLITFLIVIALLIALLAIAIPAFVRYRENAAQRMCREALRQIEAGKKQAQEAYRTEMPENKKE